jgi:hypothetical protein
MCLRQVRNRSSSFADEDLREKYTPLDKIVTSFACKTLKTMACVDFRTYVVMKLFLWSLMSSYSRIKEELEIGTT